jgi:hypothetical protein
MVGSREDNFTANFIQHHISFRSNVSNGYEVAVVQYKYSYSIPRRRSTRENYNFNPFKKPYLSAFLLTWRLCEDGCENTAKCYTSLSQLCGFRGEKRDQTPRHEHYSAHHVRKKIILVLCCIGVRKPEKSDYCFCARARNVAQVTSITAEPT